MALPESEPALAPSGPTRFQVPDTAEPDWDRVNVAGVGPDPRLLAIVPLHVPDTVACDGAAGDEPPHPARTQSTPPRIIRRTPTSEWD